MHRGTLNGRDHVPVHVYGIFDLVRSPVHPHIHEVSEENRKYLLVNEVTPIACCPSEVLGNATGMIDGDLITPTASPEAVMPASTVGSRKARAA